MSEETQKPVFQKIIEIISNDSSLCNFVNYMDYGELKKNVSSSFYEWKTKPCELNSENKLNNTQCIKFVSKIDSKFLSNLYSYNYYNSSNSTLDNVSDVLYNYIGVKKTYDRYSNNFMTQMYNYLQSIMINLDCSFEIKGTSLTALDFVGKNPNAMNLESQFFSQLYNSLNKLIFVGDKCFILAVCDCKNNIFVSTKTLETVFKLDTSSDKKTFTEIVKRLFSICARICLLCSNLKISQYINDEISNILISDFLKNKKFEKLSKTKEDFCSISDFNFNEDTDTDNYIKDNIKKIIEVSVYKCVNNKFDIDSLNIVNLIHDVRNKCEQYYKQSINESFANGVKLFRLISECGWNYFDFKYDTTNLMLNTNHNYVWKNVNIVPRRCFLYESDAKYYHIDPYRELKEEYVNEFSQRVHVDTLYLDITDGTMMCTGYHPNVSSGHQVCMGDLKGKICFANATQDEIKKMLNDCENLLTMINYSSAYNDMAKSYFLNNQYSKNVNASNDTSDTENNTSESENVIKEVEEFESDDFEEDDGSDTNTSQSNDLTEVEDDDLEELE